MTVIQCVPNISEGRRPEIISGLVLNLRRIQGLRILDFSSDSAHHRSVITMVGEKTPLHSAILLLFENALTHLDLRSHRGEHPRIGAIDVVPFVPIKNSTMADCIELAKITAKEVAKKFNIPVYFVDERFTSRIAFKIILDSNIKKMKRRDKSLIDKVSASLILETYLKRNKK